MIRQQARLSLSAHAVVRCPGLAPSVRPNRLKFAVVTSSSSPKILAVPAGSVTEETVTKQQATVPRPVGTTADRRARAQQRSHENFLLAELQIRSKAFACKSTGSRSRPPGQVESWDDAIPDLVRCPRDGPHPRRGDADQRRHTLNSAGAMPLTDPFIEGSQLRTFTSKATMYKYTARLIVHGAITGTAKGGQRHERGPHKPRSDLPVSGHGKRPLIPAIMVSASDSRLPRRGLLGAVARASSSITAGKIAGIMARRGTCRYRVAGSGDRPRNCW